MTSTLTIKNNIKTEIDKNDIALQNAKNDLADAKRRFRSIAVNDVAACTAGSTEIAELTRRVAELTTKKSELAADLRAVCASSKDQEEENQVVALYSLINDWVPQHQSVAYIIEDDQFVVVHDYASDKPRRQNVEVKRWGATQFAEVVATDLGIQAWHLKPQRMIYEMQRIKRKYHSLRYVIDNGEWNNEVYSPITHMEPFFIDKLAAEMDGTYSPYFDWLMHSVCGGKQENIEHFEKWILFKVFHYRKVTTTPSIVCVGHCGGNGKGIIQAIIAQMFPRALTTKATEKTLSGNFNAMLEGRLVVFFDDVALDNCLDVIKAQNGNDAIVIEGKGKDEKVVPATATQCFFANKLPFALSPAGKDAGVDRRFSVMRTAITFLESIKKHVLEKDGVAINTADAKQLAEAIVNETYRNRVEIARWFKALMNKYPEVLDPEYVLMALHGSDYQYFVDQQISGVDVVWRDLIEPELNKGSFVPVDVVSQLIDILEGGARRTQSRTTIKRITDLAAQNNMDITTSRVQVTYSPSVGPAVKRGAVFHKTGVVFKQKTQQTFAWSLVSDRKYNGGELSASEVIIGSSFIKSHEDEEADTNDFADERDEFEPPIEPFDDGDQATTNKTPTISSIMERVRRLNEN